MIFVAYLLVRSYGGPGSDKLAAARRAVRHGQRAVRLRVGEHLAHASTRRRRVVPTLRPGMRERVLVLRRGVLLSCSGCCWPCASGSRRSRRSSTAVSGARRSIGAVVMKTRNRRGLVRDVARAGRAARVCRDGAGSSAQQPGPQPQAAREGSCRSRTSRRGAAAGGAAPVAAYAFDLGRRCSSTCGPSGGGWRQGRARARRVAPDGRHAPIGNGYGMDGMRGPLHLHPGGAARRHRDRLDSGLAGGAGRLRGGAAAPREPARTPEVLQLELRSASYRTQPASRRARTSGSPAR